ncbi:site-specific integrase [Flavobacterium columnare]|uniref:Site-specific integrase n=2 Tax=Flavobacterium columnare TaxID=996 RepID=A0A437UD40_9FLAO|nr:site-specific integrase [Flavobacterium columnare]RVU91556.1 site-specific integrase [Flavobacterium columnare]
MNAKISTLFFVKNTKVNSKGEVPIYLRVTVNGNRFETSTNKFVEISKWSSTLKRIKGNSEEARSINEYLKIFESKVFETQKNLILESKLITVETVRNRLLNLDDNSKMLNEIFNEHNKQMELLLEVKYSLSTLKQFKTTHSHFVEFLKFRYKISDIPVSDIDIETINNFDYYLRTVRKCNNNSTVKYLMIFGKIIRIALLNGWIKSDPFRFYTQKVKTVNRTILTEEELNTLLHKTFPSSRLELVRDIFLFSCFTGLAYIDVQQLTKNNITTGIDGAKWIFKNRQKTETPSRIPLLPIAESIIQKYHQDPVCLNQDKLLPILSNQKMNAYLKEIADVCGILNSKAP